MSAWLVEEIKSGYAPSIRAGLAFSFPEQTELNLPTTLAQEHLNPGMCGDCSAGAVIPVANDADGFCCREASRTFPAPANSVLWATGVCWLIPRVWPE